MFDWNDEELADIIWGEASESGDHIVPHPKESEEKPQATFGDDSKKQWNQETINVKPAEQKTPVAKNEFSGRRLESSSRFDTNEGFSDPGFDMDSWPDLPLPIAACKGYAGNGQDSISEIPNFNSERADKVQLDCNPDFFGDEHEDKEQGGFLDYNWADIGSFDDIDRIFRNDDPIFGHDSLGNAEELWSSTDLISSPAKSFSLSAGSPSSGLGALRNTSEQYGIPMEFVPPDDQSFIPDNGLMKECDSQNLQKKHPSKDEVVGKQCCSLIDSVVECSGGKFKPMLVEKTTPETIGKTNSHAVSENSATQRNLVDKGSRQRKLSKCRIKAKEESEGKLSQDLCSTWSPTANHFQQFGNQFATSGMLTFPSSVLSPQRQIGEPDCLRHLHTSHPDFPAGCENPAYKYPIMPLMQHIHSERDKHQAVLASYECSPGPSKHANPSKESPDVSTNSLAMTRKEKIEKLRRRQQMRAMLAIQKQQQQFSHQVTCTDHSATQKRLQENQSEDTMATMIDVEQNLKISSSIEPNSPVEQDDSNTVSMVIDRCSLEETVLDQLQDVIGKLDIRIRLCIRDSLLRLAQSAMQRNSASDTSSANKSSSDENEVFAHNRSTGMLDTETETNPIDRTVAHLLFHRPSESSARSSVQDGEMPKSPVSTKLRELQTEGVGCLSQSSTEKQSISHQGAKEPCTSAEAQQEDLFKSSPYIKAPENTSNEPENGVKEVEASQLKKMN